MDWSTAVVQWLHILFASMWFGGALFSSFVLGPYLVRMPADGLRAFIVPFARHADRIVAPVAVIAISLGFIRGTVFGPVRSLDALFSTSYGRLWVVALVAAILTMTVGLRTSRGLVREAEAGADVRQATGSALRNLGLELLGFGVMLSAMVLMRFGA